LEGTEHVTTGSFVKCSKCGHANESNKKFCPKCGAPVIASASISKPLATTDSLETPTGSTVVQVKSPVETSVSPLAKSPTTSQQSLKEKENVLAQETRQESIRSLIESALIQGEYTQSIRKDVTEKGIEIGLSEEEVASLLIRLLKEKGFTPEKKNSNDQLSVKWYSAEKKKSIEQSHTEELKEKGYKSAGDFDTGNELMVERKTNSAIKPRSLPNLKWILIGAVLLLVAAAVFVSLYLFSQKKNERPVVVQPQISKNVMPTNSTNDSARILALDALRNGTDLSVTVSKIPKLKKVVEAAKELADVSPRYQEQVTTAENTLSSAMQNRDKNLLAYFGKVVELCRYKTEQISYAMSVINNGDLTLREKKVIELLIKHVDSLSKNTENDPTKLLSDFNMQFNDFVD
jgi:hypothetical protein